MSELTHLDLFSGIGGFALAAKWAGFKTVGFCEIDKYCQKILTKNFNATLGDSKSVFGNGGGGDWQQSKRQVSESRKPSSEVRIYSDVCALNGNQFKGITLLTGGFPCQPFSLAGKRRGREDDRFIWPEMLRVISEANPNWILAENVVGIDGVALDECISDLETAGYEVAPPLEIPACAVDAKHRRMRVWIIANASKQRCNDGKHHRQERHLQDNVNGNAEKNQPTRHERERWTGETSQDVADGDKINGERCNDQASQERSEQRERQIGLQDHGNGRRCKWIAEPDVGRVANGISNRVDRLRGLGNAIVPQVAYQILKAIAQIEKETE